MLTSEEIYKLTEYKCHMHNVSLNYCLPKIIKASPKNGTELFELMDDLLAWAYFNEYYKLFEGIIPYRECTGVIDEDETKH